MASQNESESSQFPCALTVSVPFPTAKLAQTAMRALSVDEELSPLVRRSFTLAKPEGSESATTTGTAAEVDNTQTRALSLSLSLSLDMTVLRTQYRATTNRMLRVSVNGFFESLGVVLQCMEELDVDVLAMTSRTSTTRADET